MMHSSVTLTAVFSEALPPAKLVDGCMVRIRGGVIFSASQVLAAAEYGKLRRSGSLPQTSPCGLKYRNGTPSLSVCAATPQPETRRAASRHRLFSRSRPSFWQYPKRAESTYCCEQSPPRGPIPISHPANKSEATSTVSLRNVSTISSVSPDRAPGIRYPSKHCIGCRSS
jgi:hypothetical protein